METSETGPEFSRAPATRQRAPVGKKPAFPKEAGGGTRRDAAEKRRPKPAGRPDVRQDLDLPQDLDLQHVPASGAAAANPRKPILTLDARGATGASPAAAPQRIAKVMARAGACSRRDAEVWIAEGRVALNGAVLTDPAINVSDADEITVDGAPLARRAPTRLFLFHKPRGLVTTEHDPEGRPTIFDHLREYWPEGPRVVSVGRLDINTEGLLLLTNDGGLARLLELPSTGWLRRYRVRAKGETDQSVLDGLRGGLHIEGVDYAGLEATLDREQGANSWLTIALREGKNREIKRVLEHIGLQVNRLIRLSFGPFQLGDIVEGAVEEVRTRVLRDQLGPLAAKAGADFSSPAREEEDAHGAGIVLQARPDARSGTRPAGAALRNSSPKREIRGFGPDRRQEDVSGVRPAKGGPRLSPQSERGASAEARGRPAPGPRKHVSALRAGEGDAQSGGRKRIERAETADRNGRTVNVERLVSAEPRGKGRDKPATRNGRRFEAERNIRDGGPRSPSRGPGRASESATQRGGGPKEAPPHRSQRSAPASRTPAFARSASRLDQAQSRRDEAPERREAKTRKENPRFQKDAGTRFQDAKPYRPKVSGKPHRTPEPGTSESRRAEADFAPRSEAGRPAGRSGSGGPPKRPERAKGKFGAKGSGGAKGSRDAKDSGGAKGSGRFTGSGGSKTSGRSTSPGRAAKPGTRRPRDKR